jgi:hypothetical protein
MRQVPELDSAPFGIVGIVGDGRVARHFRHYFSLPGLSVRTWCRHVPVLSPPDALASCRTILVLVRDDAIVPFIDTRTRCRLREGL